MKALAIVSVGLLSMASGCLDTAASTDDGEETTETAYDEIVARRCDDRGHLPNGVLIPDATGAFTTVSAHGSIDLNNEFFQDLGGNGRRCVSCHVPTVGWTITPAQLKATFALTDGGKYDDGLGLSAVFRTVDGSNSPNADVSTTAKRRKAYSMLLDKGLIRIGLPVPANAEFELVAVDDPYHFASAKELSLFRRPLPTTNLKFDSTVMWDGREVVPGATVDSELLTQASDAVTGHAQAAPLSAAQRRSIVDFEVALASAQVRDRDAGDLHDDGAKGGAAEILKQPFYIGINDNFGDSRTGAAFTPTIFDLYKAWEQTGHRRGDDHDYGHGGGHGGNHGGGRSDEARAQIARGEKLFNSRTFPITGVSGINDEAAFGNPVSLTGTCGTCHDTPNGGNHSVVAPLNIGLTDASRRTADMPLYTFRNKTTGQTIQTTDPGRGIIDGKWSHIGRFKGPMLRNLAPRAPYFHNGFAADLEAVVEFYNDRFNIHFTKQEKEDMIAFLGAL